jgi:hypothetical protein
MDLLLRLGRRCQDDRGGPSVFCLDPKSTYAQRAMEAAGVKTVSLAAPADSVAHLSMQLPSPRESATESVRVGDEEWSFWRPLLDEKEGRANLPAWCNGWTAGFSNTLGQLRQLGIKTRLLHHDYKHTRLRHSVGCATLAWRWHNRLCAEHHLPSYRDYPPSLTTLAAALHDMGHPPFSHLTEEVMDELRWTVPGADRFRHDTGPFGTAWPHVSNAAVKLVEREVGAARVELAKNRLTLLIEGRSGVPAFSAILNSPLDVDKIDYVFRDCNILNRSVHLPATGNSEKEQNERANWFAEFLSHQIVLPSGLIGLWGRAGEKARELLEERWYLYRNVYHHPSFRAVEKVVRAILTFWLCRRVSRLREPTTGIRGHFDPRSENGRLARHILWRLLTNTSDDLTPKHVEGGEAMLVHRVCDDILGVGALGEGLEMVPFLSGEEREWFDRCKFVLGKLLPSGGPERTMDELDRTVGMLITIGQPMFVSRADFNNKVRDIIRTLEYDNPFTALIDAASMPRMLSYPRQPGADSIAECYVLPHADPDHWNQSPPPRWWPLSETVFSERDKDENRQVQLLVVSPMDGDYNTVRHVTDRLRSGCDQRGVEVLEGMRNI